jgi:hypothetical protein
MPTPVHTCAATTCRLAGAEQFLLVAISDAGDTVEWLAFLVESRFQPD